VQAREVAQVLHHRQIEIEVGCWKTTPMDAKACDDASRRSRPQTRMPPVAVEQAGKQGEQRRLAGAVRPEQRRERARLDGERYAFETEAVAITEAEIVDLEDALVGYSGIQHRLTA
jgi:hypothetical protein